MRIGVIRGDLPGPIFIADVETISQFNPPTEPSGQTYYISRPTIAEVEAALAGVHGVGATIEGSDIVGSFPLTINAGNQTLRVRLKATDAFTVALLPTGVYATLGDLLAVVAPALLNYGVIARQGTGSGARFALESSVRGVSSYLEIDTVAHLSTFNTPAGLLAGGSIRTMPTAAEYITACLPVGGPLNVSYGTLDGVGAATAANALLYSPVSRGTEEAIAGAIAPRIIETPVAIKSFQVGQIAKFRSANFNPDPTRLPAFPSSAAILVVQDDGVSAFVAPLPNLTSAILGPSLVINGVGLGTNEINATTVKVTGTISKVVTQQMIRHVGGLVSATQIVVPLSLLPGIAAITCFVQVKSDSLASNIVAVA